MHDVNNDALVFICWAGKTAKKCTEFLYNLILNKIGDNNKNKILYLFVTAVVHKCKTKGKII